MSKNILFILMPENYRDEEFYIPFNILKKKGYNVDVAGFKSGIAKGVEGHEHTPNLLLPNLSDKEFNEYDALVIPGGPGSTQYLWDNSEIQNIIKYFHDNKKIVAAICYACIALVQAGILKNKKATVYPTEEAKEILEKNNVQFDSDSVVTLKGEKIITAQGPKFAKEFGMAIIDILEQ